MVGFGNDGSLLVDFLNVKAMCDFRPLGWLSNWVTAGRKSIPLRRRRSLLG
jgi:hypothetical protein